MWKEGFEMSSTITPPSSQMTGLMFAAGSALSLSILTTAATFAYRGGADPVTLIAARAMSGFLSAAFLVLLLRQRPRIAPGNGGFMLIMSVGQLMINFGYMTSVLYISVSLAALIFYIFPVLVMLIEAIISKRKPTPLEAATFAAAFIGLGLALGPSFENLDWRGLVAALTATAGGTMLMVAGSRAVRRAGALPTFFHMQFIACSVTAMVMLAFDGPTLPETSLGAWGLGVACAGYVIGVGMQVIAIKLVEPALVSLIYNLEPLGTLIIAAWLLSERLDTLQYLGGGLVLLSIIIAGQRASRRQS
jgi:drug/metabolite transporter (DMT)-like permease